MARSSFGIGIGDLADQFESGGSSREIFFAA